MLSEKSFCIAEHKFPEPPSTPSMPRLSISFSSSIIHGDGTSGALGVKEVVKWLNSRGYRTREGKTFGVGTIYRILINTTYG
jgi:hypothetical protein